MLLDSTCITATYTLYLAGPAAQQGPAGQRHGTIHTAFATAAIRCKYPEVRAQEVLVFRQAAGFNAGAKFKVIQKHARCAVYLTAAVRLQYESLGSPLLAALEILQQAWQVLWQHIGLRAELVVGQELRRHC